MTGALSKMFGNAASSAGGRVAGTAMGKMFGGKDSEGKQLAQKVGQDIGSHYGKQLYQSAESAFKGNGFSPIKSPSWSGIAAGVGGALGGMAAKPIAQKAGEVTSTQLQKHGADPGTANALGAGKSAFTGSVLGTTLGTIGANLGSAAVGGGVVSGLGAAATFWPAAIIAGLTIADKSVDAGVTEWKDWFHGTKGLAKNWEYWGKDKANEDAAGRGYAFAAGLAKHGFDPQGYSDNATYAVKDVLSGGEFGAKRRDKVAVENAGFGLQQAGYRYDRKSNSFQDKDYFISDKQLASRMGNPYNTLMNMYTVGKGGIRPDSTDPMYMLWKNTTHSLQGKDTDALAQKLAGGLKDYRHLERAIPYTGYKRFFGGQRNFLEKVLSYKPEGYEYQRASEIDWRT